MLIFHSLISSSAYSVNWVQWVFILHYLISSSVDWTRRRHWNGIANLAHVLFCQPVATQQSSPMPLLPSSSSAWTGRMLSTNKTSRCLMWPLEFKPVLCKCMCWMVRRCLSPTGHLHRSALLSKGRLVGLCVFVKFVLWIQSVPVNNAHVRHAFKTSCTISSDLWVPWYRKSTNQWSISRNRYDP